MKIIRKESNSDATQISTESAAKEVTTSNNDDRTQLPSNNDDRTQLPPNNDAPIIKKSAPKRVLQTEKPTPKSPDKTTTTTTSTTTTAAKSEKKSKGIGVNEVAGIAVGGVVGGIMGAGIDNVVGRSNGEVDHEINDLLKGDNDVAFASTSRSREDFIREIIESKYGSDSEGDDLAESNNDNSLDYTEVSGFESESVDTIIMADDMTFDEAFGAAREMMGAGGAFMWNDNIYNTYYESEWNEMSPEEQADFISNINVPNGVSSDEEEEIEEDDDFDVDNDYDDDDESDIDDYDSFDDDIDIC